MKNASQIITSIQYKPQFKKILDYKCINKLISILLPSIRKSIKHGYIHKNIFYITIHASLNKYDKDNIINTIKMVLNSKIILQEKGFLECSDIKIDDVIVYVDHKPKLKAQLHTTQTHNLTYVEQATGDIDINIKDKKLHDLAASIQELIKKENNDT